jgi:hypothetical protein
MGSYTELKEVLFLLWDFLLFSLFGVLFLARKILLLSLILFFSVLGMELRTLWHAVVDASTLPLSYTLSPFLDFHLAWHTMATHHHSTMGFSLVSCSAEMPAIMYFLQSREDHPYAAASLF